MYFFILNEFNRFKSLLTTGAFPFQDLCIVFQSFNFLLDFLQWENSSLWAHKKGERDHLITSIIKEYSLQCSVSNVSVQSPTPPPAHSVGDDCQSLKLQPQMSNWCSGTMSSGKTVKLVLYEVLQFAALIIPIFVIMERFASLISDVKGHDVTTYWLVVAVSIAYVTSVTLLVWVPLKYLILKKRRLIREITQWWVLLLKGQNLTYIKTNVLDSGTVSWRGLWLMWPYCGYDFITGITEAVCCLWVFSVCTTITGCFSVCQWLMLILCLLLVISNYSCSFSEEFWSIFHLFVVVSCLFCMFYLSSATFKPQIWTLTSYRDWNENYSNMN